MSWRYSAPCRCDFDTIEEYQEAMRYYEDAADLYADEYFELGVESLKLGAFDATIANYDKAISMNPRHTDAYINKARLLHDKGAYREALACINKVFEIAPTDFKALYNRGKTLYAMNELDLAAADLDRAISIKKDNISAHQLFGDILDQMGNEESATLHWAIAERLRKKRGRK